MGTDNGLPLYSDLEMNIGDPGEPKAHGAGFYAHDVRPHGKLRHHGSVPPLSALGQPNQRAAVILGVVVILALLGNLWILLSVKNTATECPECPTVGTLRSYVVKQSARATVPPNAANDKPLVVQDQAGNMPEKMVSTLLVSILTVPRPHNERYLMQAISSLRQEIFSSSGMNVAVLVSNLRPDAHEVFEEVKAIFHRYFTFENLVPRKGVELGWEGKWGMVTPNMYQLNLDFLESLISVHNHCTRDRIENVLLLEDDFQWCPLGFSHLIKALNKVAETEPNWLALRVSYGNNGLALRCQDMPLVIKFAEETKKLGPLDSLLGEYLTSGAEELGSRPYYVYRYNLLSHIGTVSARVQGSYSTTGRSEGRLCYPVCYGLIQYVGLMPKENFMTTCIDSDFSPCKQCGSNCHGMRHDEVLRSVARRTELGEC